MFFQKGKPSAERVFSLIGGLVVFFFFHNSGINNLLAGFVETPELSALAYVAAGVAEAALGYFVSYSIFGRIYKLEAEAGVKAALGVFVSVIFVVMSVFVSGLVTFKPAVAKAAYTPEALEVRLGIMAADTNQDLPMVLQEDFLMLERMSSENLSLVYHYVFNISDEQAARLTAESDAGENLKNLMFLGEGNHFCEHQSDLLTHGVSFVALYSTSEGTEFAKAVITKADCGL